MSNTIEQLLEVEDQLQEISKEILKSSDPIEIESLVVDNTMLLRHKTALLNNFWLEIFEVGVELTQESTTEKLINSLFKPIDI